MSNRVKNIPEIHTNVEQKQLPILRAESLTALYIFDRAI